MKSRPTPFALFAAFNAAQFAVVLAVFCADRLHPFYRGPANLAEFTLYSLTVALVAVVGWRTLRRVAVPAPVLALCQLGILGHLAGGFATYHGVRLYDVVFFGVGYDHYLHTFNGFAGALLADRLLPPMRGPIPRGLIVLLVMMGAGSIVEMIEYLAYLWISMTGVGGYDNNMRDLLSNTFGGLIFVAARALLAAQALLAARPAVGR